MDVRVYRCGGVWRGVEGCGRVWRGVFLRNDDGM